jgi:hypothetical protein
MAQVKQENNKKDHGQEKEISRETVEAVEKSNFMPLDKANILLTEAGLKPASWVSSFTYNEFPNGEKRNFKREDVERDRALLKKMLPCKKEKEINIDAPLGEGRFVAKGDSFLIASTQESLDRLSSAIDKKDDRETGLALGFCETAVDAYCSGDKEKLLDESTLPMEDRLTEAMAFNPGRLSKDHWFEELQQYQKWADYVRVVSPAIYIQTMEEKFKSLGIKK